MTDIQPADDEQIAEWERLEQALPAHGWSEYIEGSVVEIQNNKGDEVIHWSGFDASDYSLATQKRVCKFMVASRLAVPALIRRIEAERERADKAEARVKALTDAMRQILELRTSPDGIKNPVALSLYAKQIARLALRGEKWTLPTTRN